MTEKQIEEALNVLISKATENGGHVYIVDKKHNSFALRLTKPIKIQFYGGYKGAQNERADDNQGYNQRDTANQ